MKTYGYPNLWDMLLGHLYRRVLQQCESEDSRSSDGQGSLSDFVCQSRHSYYSVLTRVE
jgi:hypothetical protein